MSYYEGRKAKVSISQALINKGWKIYGFHADQSDMMTDYYHPASWDGIATKNGYTLVIDAYRGMSGKEIKVAGKNVDYKKIAKLEALRDNKAASKGEKVNAQTMIDKMYQKADNSVKVVDVYPTYTASSDVSKMTKWHVEKEGAVIAKGNGIYKFAQLSYDYDCSTMEWVAVNRNTDFNYDLGCWNRALSTPSEEDQKLINQFDKFIAKIEKAVETKIVIGDGTEKTEAEGLANQSDDTLIKVKKTRKKKVMSVVELPEITDMKDAEYFMLKVSFTHGCSRGTVYKITKEHGYPRAYRMNRKYTKVLTGSSTPANRFTGDVGSLNKWLAKGSLVACTLKEVIELEEYEVWEKVKNDKNVNESQTTTKTDVKADEKDTATPKHGENSGTGFVNDSKAVEVTFNDEKEGIEIRFTIKPSRDVLDSLGRFGQGFRWSSKQKIWYAKDTPERREFVENTFQV